MTHHTDTERAEFEAAIRATMHDAGEDHIAERLERWPDGAYKDRATGYAWWGYQKAARRAPAVPVPQGWKITEEMHVAAVKVLHRASGVDGLPQRMVDAMLAAAPQPPEAAQLGDIGVVDMAQAVDSKEAAPVQLPEPQAEIEVRSMKTYLDLSIHEWRDTLPDGAYNIYTEQQVRDLLAAHGIGKDKA